jgi:hypothetical protein
MLRRIPLIRFNEIHHLLILHHPLLILCHNTIILNPQKPMTGPTDRFFLTTHSPQTGHFSGFRITSINHGRLHVISSVYPIYNFIPAPES